ncbi:MAG: FAD binding domain-containing protein, partial [Blastocatellia bacterium]
MNTTPTAHSVRTLDEAYALLAARGRAARVIAGGTDLMVSFNTQPRDIGEYIDIWRLDELRGVSDTGNAIRIGALTTYTQLIHAPLLREHAPALIAASRT